MNAVIAEDLRGDGFWMATEVEDHVQIGPDLFLREAGECGDLQVEFWRCSPSCERMPCECQ